MDFWKRIFPYLILNVVVTAVTTLLILVVWDRVQHPALPTATGGGPVVSAETSNGSQGAPSAQATLPPLEEPIIRIETVIGAGDLATETIQLQRIGEGDLQMQGWQLEGNGKEFIFPNLTLNKNGSVRLNTRAGQSSVIELFWGLESPVWRSGYTISLYDPAGNLRASYSIP